MPSGSRVPGGCASAAPSQKNKHAPQAANALVLVFIVSAPLPPAQVSIEELHDHVVAVARFGYVRVVEEAVKQSFPHVQVGCYALLHELRVRVHRAAELEAARARY